MNQMGMVADAERLPWLTDDKPRRSGRTPSLLWLGLLAAILVAGVSYWAGLQSIPPAGEPASVAPSATIALPEPASDEPVVGPAEPPVVTRPEPSIADAQPQRVRTPEAEPQRAARPVERKSPPRAKRRAVPEKAAAKPEPKSSGVEFWPVREVNGASGRMVRIGTFATARQAKRGWWKVVGTYPGMKRIPTLVVPVQSLRNGQTYYRLQMGTTSQAHSTVLCQRMRIIGQSCVVIGLPAA